MVFKLFKEVIYGITIRPPLQPVSKNKMRLFRFGLSGYARFYFAVINPKKLVGTGCHIDKIWLAFRPLLVKELIHPIICRRFMKQRCHNQE